MARYDDDHSAAKTPQPKDRRHTDPHPKDRQCIQTDGLMRCTLPAVDYPGHSRNGYCDIHKDRSRVLEGDALHRQLVDIRDNRNKYIAQAEAEDWRELMVRDCIEANHEWVRDEGENARDYALRMLAKCKTLGKGIRGKYRHG